MEKIDLIKGCYKSLIHAIREVKHHNVRLTVLDDHSSLDLVEFLKSTPNDIKFELIQLEEKGYNNSAYQQFKMCRDSTADLVYSVEDDYLHVRSALKEMIDSHEIFQSKIKDHEIVLYPFDAPEEYDPPKERCFVVHGSQRHWRSGIYTTNVLFATPRLFQTFWEPFEILALKYNGNYIRKKKETEPRVHESNTIWKIWENFPVLRFNPIPSIALHMQFDAQLDPFIDWEGWWSEYTKDF